MVDGLPNVEYSRTSDHVEQTMALQKLAKPIHLLLRVTGPKNLCVTALEAAYEDVFSVAHRKVFKQMNDSLKGERQQFIACRYASARALCLAHTHAVRIMRRASADELLHERIAAIVGESGSEGEDYDEAGNGRGAPNGAGESRAGASTSGDDSGAAAAAQSHQLGGS